MRRLKVVQLEKRVAQLEEITATQIEKTESKTEDNNEEMDTLRKQLFSNH